LSIPRHPVHPGNSVIATPLSGIVFPLNLVHCGDGRRRAGVDGGVLESDAVAAAAVGCKRRRWGGTSETSLWNDYSKGVASRRWMTEQESVGSGGPRRGASTVVCGIGACGGVGDGGEAAPRAEMVDEVVGERLYEGRRFRVADGGSESDEVGGGGNHGGGIIF
jgi:hypothetical protein